MDGRDYGVLSLRLLLAFILFFSTRILFAAFNWDYYVSCTLLEMSKALLVGLRFDLATVLIVNVLFIIFSLIPIQHHFYFWFKKVLFFLTNFIFLFLNIVDMKFFSFIGRKITIDIFDMGSDITDQSLQIALNFWYMGFVVLFYAVSLWRFYAVKKKSILFIPKLNWLKVSLIGGIGIILTFIGIRGGIQMRSLSPKQAYTFNKYELGNMTLNSTYTFIRSIGKKSTQEINYFKSDLAAVDLIKSKRIFSPSGIKLGGQNVVLIIIESFSQEYIEDNWAPFFLELSKKSYYSNTNYANGRRSLEALPSILAGIPSLVGKPLYQTQYQANHYFPLPQILKDKGYETSFFHGGKKGTMDFDAYCASIGVEKYYSKEDYPNSEHYDGYWGIYDHHYLKYVAGEIDKFNPPFFSSIFTLSSHQPYSIPKEFESTIPKGELEIHKSISYVDMALKDFFEFSKDKEWFKNTLFVITADHTQKMRTKEFNSDLGKYRVPLLLYHPRVDLSRFQNQRITQHVDIMPTILDVLEVENNYPLYFGTSVFNSDRGRMINYLSNRFFYLSPPNFVTMIDNKPQYFKVDSLTNALSPTDENLEVLGELKAYIQYMNNGLKNNSLYSIKSN
jgi:phosphoglycerol transferase MdoB-like AlkP superfamily enzyme